MNNIVNFDSLYLNDQFLGHHGVLSFPKKEFKAHLYFGSRHLNLDFIKKTLPGIHVSRIKQVHGDQILQAEKSKIVMGTVIGEADAQWTTDFKLAIPVITADCIPVLLVSSTGKACAIHAGWRGVAAEIIPKSLKLVFAKEFESGEPVYAFIGPHIRQPTFEVGLDVAEKIKSISHHLDVLPENLFSPYTNKEKLLVNLTAVAKAQLLHAKVDRHNITVFPQNTYLDTQYASFRRDRDKGRQLSLICLESF